MEDQNQDQNNQPIPDNPNVLRAQLANPLDEPSKGTLKQTIFEIIKDVIIKRNRFQFSIPAGSVNFNVSSSYMVLAGAVSPTLIAFDAVGGTAVVNPATSLTFSHTCSGVNRLLIVGIDTTTVDDITSVTYAGVAMTLACKVQGGAANNDVWNYLYYLVAPATGANNIVISKSSSTIIVAASVSYTGVKQTGQPDATQTKFAGVAGSETITITTVADNSWVVIWGRTQNSITAGTNVTARVGTGTTILLGDSNGVVHPAGSFGQTLTDAGATSWGLLQMSFSPATSTGLTISKIKGGHEGMILTLEFTDSNITITDDSSGDKDTVNLSSTFNSTINDTLQLIYNGTSWRELTRSVN